MWGVAVGARSSRTYHRHAHTAPKVLEITKREPQPTARVRKQEKRRRTDDLIRQVPGEQRSRFSATPTAAIRFIYAI